jgi:hypothetical protein
VYVVKGRPEVREGASPKDRNGLKSFSKTFENPLTNPTRCGTIRMPKGKREISEVKKVRCT